MKSDALDDRTLQLPEEGELVHDLETIATAPKGSRGQNHESGLKPALAEKSEHTPVDLVIAALERDVSAELDLDDAQRQQLHESLQITAKDFKGLRIEIWQKAREKTRESLDRIASQLPPEKAAKLRERAISRLKPWGLLE